jgi:hypothetical protein
MSIRGGGTGKDPRKLRDRGAGLGDTAILQMRDVRRVRIWGRTRAHAERLTERVQAGDLIQAEQSGAFSWDDLAAEPGSFDDEHRVAEHVHAGLDPEAG